MDAAALSSWSLTGLLVAAVLVLGGCRADERGVRASTAADGPPATSAAAVTVVVDPDPYDGVIGQVVLTPGQVAYRDGLGLTDAEAHDAFRYSCSVPTGPGTSTRFANQPPTSQPPTSSEETP